MCTHSSCTHHSADFQIGMRKVTIRPINTFNYLTYLKEKRKIYVTSGKQLNLAEKVSERLQEIVGMATLKEQIL